jgi:hypothetical protein
MSGTRKPDQSGDVGGISEIMRLLDDEPAGTNTPRDSEFESEDDTLGTTPVPRLTRIPDGIEVIEQPFGQAVGHWILQVRCECGRRWFEVEAVESATCPRCGSLVLVSIENGRPGQR